MTVTIERPPIVETFDLPTRGELLAVKPGDYVKLIFDLPNGVERMWVKVTNTNIDYTNQWEGTLANSPFGGGMEFGDTILFHPLDAIDVTHE